MRTHACAALHGLVRNRMSALIIAAANCREEVVALLLATPGVDINAVDKYRCADMGRRRAGQTYGHVDACVWTGPRVWSSACCGMEHV